MKEEVSPEKAWNSCTDEAQARVERIIVDATNQAAELRAEAVATFQHWEDLLTAAAEWERLADAPAAVVLPEKQEPRKEFYYDRRPGYDGKD